MTMMIVQVGVKFQFVVMVKFEHMIIVIQKDHADGVKRKLDVIVNVMKLLVLVMMTMMMEVMMRMLPLNLI